MNDIPVKCTRCKHQCMESAWVDKPLKGFDGVTEKTCPKCGCRSYFDMRPQVAWCWATGLIEIGDAMPAGAILVATGPKCELQSKVAVVARTTRTGPRQLLVPGVPEAANEAQARKALGDWLAWCAKSNGTKYAAGVTFAGQQSARVDCGECPNVTSGCERGQCIKGSTS